MATYRDRLLPFGGIVYDTLEFLQVDGYTRIPGILPSDLSLDGAYNGSTMVWPLVSGVGVTDQMVLSGSVYWVETFPGRYSIRWRPTSQGRWSWSFRYSTVPQMITLSCDLVTSLTPTPSPGISARFVP